MIKTVLSAAALLLLSSIATAYPAVNDSAAFKGSYVQKGSSFPVTLVNSIKAANKATGQFLVSEMQTIAGQTDSTDAWVNEDDLVSPAQIQNILANCGAQGGNLEAVATPAGAFKTCKLAQTDEDGGLQTYWFADVPFGLAQFSVAGVDEQNVPYQINLQLSALTRGQ